MSSREKPVPLHVSVPNQYRVCNKHADAQCIFDGRAYRSCPFCVAQDMINPSLKDTSPLKGARSTNNHYTKSPDEEIESDSGFLDAVGNTEAAKENVEVPL